MRRTIWLWAVLVLLCLQSGDFAAYASQETLPEAVSAEYESELQQYDFSEIDEYLRQQTKSGGNGLSLEELMKLLLAGDLKEAMKLLVANIKYTFSNEIAHSAGLMRQILVLGVIGAVFANFSSIFSGNQVSETGFYVIYLLLFTFLAASFQESLSITYQVVGQVLDFMQVLSPAYFMAVAFSGATTSSAAWCQLVLIMISLVDGLFLHILLPLIRVYVLLVLVGHITKEDLFSKWTELLKTGISWAMKGLVGLVIGFQAVQGLILPYVDSMKIAGVQKLVEVVPVVGQGASSVSQLVFGAGVLIKNTMGAAGVLILFFLVSVPIFKLVILMLLYQCMAAVLEPICDKRVISCISSVADGHKMLLGMVLAASLLFIIALALVCITTNATYLA